MSIIKAPKPFKKKVSPEEIQECQEAARKELLEFVEGLQKKYNVTVFPAQKPPEFQINVVHNSRFQK